MAGLGQFLQTELNNLSNETRRRHPEIKQASDKAVLIINSLKEGSFKNSDTNFAEELSKSEDVIKPFVLCFPTKNTKLVLLAMNCLQKLISYHAVNESTVPLILTSISDLLGSTVDIQLKMLQTILPLLTNYPSLHGEILGEALVLCFRLHESKTAVVQNTAAATLRQIVIFLFEKVVQEDEKLEVEPHQAGFVARYTTIVPFIADLKPSAFDAFLLFQDLCWLSNGETPIFLRLESLNKTFGLELIESVLSNHYRLFKKHEAFTKLLKDRICPLLMKSVSERSDFPQVVRLMRVIFILIKYFAESLCSECEMFMSMFSDILDSPSPFWLKILCMEIYRGLFSDFLLLKTLYCSYDQNGVNQVFQETLNTLGKVASTKPAIIGFSKEEGMHSDENPTSLSGLSINYSPIKIQCIDQLDKTEPPSIPETYLPFLALNCFIQVAEGLSNLVSTNKLFVQQYNQPNALPLSLNQNLTSSIGVGFVHYQPEQPNLDEQQLLEHRKQMKIYSQMTELAYKPLLAAFIFFFHTKIDADLFHNLLKAYQNFLIAAGVLKLAEIRDLFLYQLCKMITEDQNHSKFSNKRLYSLRSLIHVSFSLSPLLNPRCWFMILQTFRYADYTLGKGTSYLKISLQTFQDLRQDHLYLQKHLQKSQDVSDSNISAFFHEMNLLFLGSKLWTASALYPLLIGLIWTTVDATGFLSSNPIDMEFENPSMSPIGDLGKALSHKNLLEMSDRTKSDIFHDQKSPVKNLSSLSAFQKVLGISVDDLFKAANQPTFLIPKMKSDERLFTLDRLRDVVLLNLERLIWNTETNVMMQSPPMETLLIRFHDSWDLIVYHLLCISTFPSILISLMTQSSEILSQLILSVVELGQQKLLQENFDEFLQKKILIPLKDLILLKAPNDFIIEREQMPEWLIGKMTPGAQLVQSQREIQKLGLETMNRLIRVSGQYFTSVGYEILFDVFKSISKNEKTHHVDLPLLPLIKTAFPALQLICTDYLSVLNAINMLKCIESVGLFAQQQEDLNISLTCIGLLWNLCDALNQDDQPSIKEKKVELGFCILKQLKSLAVDDRSEIRHSGVQTLFRAVQMTLGNHWQTEDWQNFMNEILFPLLESIQLSTRKVRHSLLNPQMAALISENNNEAKPLEIYLSLLIAEKEKPEQASNQIASSLKQWEETKILTMYGLSQFIQTFIFTLWHIKGFFKQENDQTSIWSKMMDFLYQEFCGFDQQDGKFVLRKISPEVVHSSVKTIKEIFNFLLKKQLKNEEILLANHICKETFEHWLKMGHGLLQRKRALKVVFECFENLQTEQKVLNSFDFLHQQESLLLFMTLFKYFWPFISNREKKNERQFIFGISEFHQFCQVERICLAYFDLTYDLIELPLNDLKLAELFHALAQPKNNYMKLNTKDDLNYLSPVQKTLLEFIFTPTLLSAYLSPQSASFEKEDVAMPNILEFLIQETNGTSLACVFLKEWMELTSLAFRKGILNHQFPKGGNFVSTISPVSTSLSLSGKFSTSTMNQKNCDQSELKEMVHWTRIQKVFELPTPTFIHFSKILLLLIKDLFSAPQSVFERLLKDNALFEQNFYLEMLRGFKVPLSLKYDLLCEESIKSPSAQHSGSQAKLTIDTEDHKRGLAVELWKLSNQTFLVVMKHILKHISDIFHQSKQQLTLFPIWQILIEILESSLQTVLPPVDLNLNEFFQDEQFEINFLFDFIKVFTSTDVPCDEKIFSSLTEILSDASRVWYPWFEGRIVPDLWMLTQGEKIVTIPVMKEQLSFKCLELLFQFCQVDASADPKKKFQLENRKLLANVAFKSLIKRSKEALLLFIQEIPIHSTFPFPRLRLEEVKRILELLLQLKLYPGIQFDFSIQFREENYEMAHLIYLYPELSQMLTFSQPEIQKLLMLILQTIGNIFKPGK